MAMLESIKRRAGWKRKSKTAKPTDPHNRPIISAPIPSTPPPDIKLPYRINYAHKQHYRIPYAVPRPVAAEQKSTSVRRRLTIYFKKDAKPTVSVTPIPVPDSLVDTTLLTSRNNSVQPLSPAFSSKSMMSSTSQDCTQLLKRNSINIKVPARGKSVKMPNRRESLKVPSRPKSFRRASGDLLSVYTFLGGQETISSDPQNRRASRFYMDGQYQTLAGPMSPGVPKVPAWATAQ